ncbi:helix-turn-helix domain-containing protein [Streptomyces sp. NPDC047002]|uniref:TetR/AcrR family transcriptional regulator n=1 Tax=Streptomyces sp. NPDC047002 TaxID=3155475 RepID=UPI003451FD77
MVRMSAEERRESVIRAAVEEFARGGYHGTSTEAVARRVGVSQPYLFRLFPSKQEIFLAACERCLDDMVRAFREAGEGLEGEEAVHAMAAAYQRGIAERPERLLLQMQMYAAAAAADAAGDRPFGERLRRGWLRVWDAAEDVLGAGGKEATEFMAYGMLINTLVSLGFPAGHRVWETVWESAQPLGGDGPANPAAGG